MSELIDLTAAQAAERITAGEIDAAELFEAYRQRAAADELMRAVAELATECDRVVLELQGFADRSSARAQSSA